MFLDALGKSAKKSGAVVGFDFVEEFVVLGLNVGEELNPSCSRPVELGICAGNSGAFSDYLSSREFIHEIIVGVSV